MSRESLDSALGRIERLVGEMLGGADRKQEILREVFELNNEIGRRSREDREMKLKLIPLQQWVNALTVATKRADANAMDDAVIHARQALAKLLE